MSTTIRLWLAAFLSLASPVAAAEFHVVDGDTIDIERHGLDRYGRTLAIVTVAGVDVAVPMIAEGHARPWRGRRQPWCP